MESTNATMILVREGFTAENADLLRNETLFHNANGYIGVRGCWEEGYPHGYDTIRGQYINGYYNSYPIQPEEWHIGFLREKHTMVNTFDTQTINLEIDGEPVDLFTGKVLSFRRTLDMKKGITRREFRWESPEGRILEAEITRMTSFEMLPLFTIEYRVRAVNFTGKLTVQSAQEGNVSNYFNQKDSRVAGEKRHHIDVQRVEMLPDETGLLVSSTTNSGLESACAVRHQVSVECEKQFHTSDTRIDYFMTMPLKQGEEVCVTKYTVMCDVRRYEQPAESAVSLLEQAVSRGLAYWYMRQTEYLDDFWNRSAIVLDGDEELNLSLNFSLYGLLQSAGKDGKSNIGAKGLSGEGYMGHYFWDTEMYMLPFFSLTQPELAKKLLGYRYSILNAARDNARRMGHPVGALFPWRTINGKECSYYYPAGGAQYHINGDISYAVIQYFLLTGDWDYMRQQGAEILFETARVWYDLGNFCDGRFEIHDVTGPDEYTCIVSNNYYTNVSAQYNLRWAKMVYEHLKKENQLADLEKRIGITEQEIEGFAKAAKQMYLVYDAKRDITPQDDSFLRKKRWELDTIPEGQGPLMQHNFLYHIYRYQICKQADAVLAHFLFEDAQKLSTMRNSFEYYEKITTHDSSLSRCIFSIMASKLQMEEKAYDYFSFSSKTDLLDTQKNTKDGIHTACMGGTYMAIVFGFLGLRIKDRGFFFTPRIPKQWKSCTLRLVLRDRLIEVSADANACRFTLLKGAPITLYVYGKAYKLNTELYVGREEDK